jgi:hypothetical protein
VNFSLQRLVGAILLLAVALSVFPSRSDAEPRIQGAEGSALEGDKMRIKGDGFGEKPNARPILWADFEEGLKPSKGGQKKSWDKVENMEWGKYAIENKGCAIAADGSGVWTMAVDHDYWSKEGTRMYIFRRQRMNFTISNPQSQNWKIWRMWPNGVRYPNIYIGANGLVDVENVGGKGGFYGQTYVPSIDWMTDEIFFQASNLGVKDGAIRVRCNGVDMASGAVMSRSAKSPAYMSRNYVVHGVAANLGRWSPPWSPSNRIWVDEVYADNSWSRVMFGDKPLKRETRVWEIQIPSRWSDTEIELEAHPGIFTEGQTAYLYVFDSENRSNETGFPVVIGQNAMTLAREK